MRATDLAAKSGGRHGLFFSNERSYLRSRKAGLRGFLYLLVAAFSLMFFFPFFWSISCSLKTAFEMMAYPPKLLPELAQWGNYKEVWTKIAFARYTYNSIVVTFFSLTGQVASASIVAYGFARLRFPLKGLLFGLVLSTMILPSQVTIIPLYIIYQKFGWLDTFKPLIVPYYFGGGAFSIFLLRQFFMTLPIELDEAALIDGAGRLRIFLQIVIPNSRPVLATVAIFGFIAHWEEFFEPLIFLNTNTKYTIPMGLYYLKRFAMVDPGMTKDHLLMAGSVMATMPIILLFFVAQRYFIRGIVMSGIKG